MEIWRCDETSEKYEQATKEEHGFVEDFLRNVIQEGESGKLIITGGNALQGGDGSNVRKAKRSGLSFQAIRNMGNPYFMSITLHDAQLKTVSREKTIAVKIYRYDAVLISLVEEIFQRDFHYSEEVLRRGVYKSRSEIEREEHAEAIRSGRPRLY